MAAKETARSGRGGQAHRHSYGVDSLLRELATTEAQREAAQRDLNVAIANFKDLAADLKERRRVADTRRALAELDAALKATRGALQSLPLPARTLFMRAWRSAKVPSPARLIGTLGAAELATRLAIEDANKLPHKSPNYAIQILAYDVARTIKFRLHIKPTMTRDNLATGARGGAAYARLLRAVLEQAGGSEVEDLSALMRLGLHMLADPTLPTTE